MIHYSTIISIRRSPADVFAALLDPDRYADWTDMVDTRFEGPAEPQLGTRGEFRFPAGPLKGRYDFRIVALEPNRKLDFEIDGPIVHWISRIDLEPEGDGTRMTYAGDISLLGWRRLLEPVMAREAQAGEAHEAERLKALMEAEAIPALAGA